MMDPVLSSIARCRPTMQTLQINFPQHGLYTHALSPNGSMWQQIGHSSRPGSGERNPDAVDNGGDNEASVVVLVAASFSRSICWDGLLEDEEGDGDISAATLVAASLFSFGIGRAV